MTPTTAELRLHGRERPEHYHAQFDSGAAAPIPASRSPLRGDAAQRDLRLPDCYCAGIGYEASPAVHWVRGDPALGINNTHLFGGLAGFHFGRAIALQGYYFASPTIAADPTILPPTPDFDPVEVAPELSVRSAGANLVLNLQRTLVAPFLRAGGGVLRLSPRDGPAANQIQLNLGGGLRLGYAGEPSWEVFVEDWMVRLNRYHLFTPGGMLLRLIRRRASFATTGSWAVPCLFP